MEIRDLRPDETPFLQEMLYTALAWRTGVELPPLEWVMDHPQLAPFHTAWRRDGDTALVAEDAVPIGLAWYRFFTDAEHGEGFVDLAVDHDNPARHLYERLGYVASRKARTTTEWCSSWRRVPPVEAFVPIPETGRTFRVAYTVRLSDTDATGRLRLDAIARYLQDAAIDDVQETGWGSPEHLWVLRSVRIDVLTPFLADAEVGIVTWGSSFSALAAGRRWSLSGDAGGSIEVDSVWIHLGPDARPARIGVGFDGYSQAAQGRVASTKLTLALPPIDGNRRLWPLRVTDVDRMGHVNNAAYWAAVEQRLAEVGLDPRRPLCARLDYRHPIDLGERVELAEHVEGGSYHVAFVVGSVVKAAARVDPL